MVKRKKRKYKRRKTRRKSSGQFDLFGDSPFTGKNILGGSMFGSMFEGKSILDDSPTTGMDMGFSFEPPEQQRTRQVKRRPIRVTRIVHVNKTEGSSRGEGSTVLSSLASGAVSAVSAVSNTLKKRNERISSERERISSYEEIRRKKAQGGWSKLSDEEKRKLTQESAERGETVDGERLPRKKSTIRRVAEEIW